MKIENMFRIIIGISILNLLLTSIIYILFTGAILGWW